MECDHRNSPLTDNEIIFFVWRWKVVSMAMILTNFMKKCGHDRVYVRTRSLIRKGYLRDQYLPDTHGFAIVLTAKGASRIQDDLPTDNASGFRSDKPEHDFYLAGIHYGLSRLHEEFFTESYTDLELRNSTPNNYPNSVPKTVIHRPDGYLLAGNEDNSAVVALELEWSPKEKSRYADLAEFYSKYTNVFGVWIAKTNFIAKNIYAALNQNHILRGKRHLIFEWNEIKLTGWNAKSSFTSNPRSLAEIVPKPYHKNTQRLQLGIGADWLLLPNKAPFISKRYKDRLKTEKFTDGGPIHIAPSLNITPTTLNFDPAVTHQPNKEEPSYE